MKEPPPPIPLPSASVAASCSARSRPTNPPIEAAALRELGDPACAPHEAKKRSIREEDAADAPAKGDAEGERGGAAALPAARLPARPNAEAARAATASDAGGHPRGTATASPRAMEHEAAARERAALRVETAEVE